MTNEEPRDIHTRPANQVTNNRQTTLGHQHLTNGEPLEINKTQTIKQTSQQTTKEQHVGYQHITNKEPLEIDKRPANQPRNNQQTTIGDQRSANEEQLEIHKRQTNKSTHNQQQQPPLEINRQTNQQASKQTTIGDQQWQKTNNN